MNGGMIGQSLKSESMSKLSPDFYSGDYNWTACKLGWPDR